MIQLSLTDINFPNPKYYDPEDGLIAFGGDLSPERLWFAYQLGIFPWFNPGEEILWWCLDPRFVLYPSELKVSKSMRKVLRDNQFKITENVCFEQVMRECQQKERVGQDGTWISDELVQSFTTLHQAGLATSVEVWENDELVGGLYGLKVGRVFCGESMFSKVSNASKAGFITFVQNHLSDFDIIDCQSHTSHLESLGAKMISKQQFLTYFDAYADESD